MLCLNCNQNTENEKFCSKSCSVTYYNKLSPKVKKKVRLCKVCSKPTDRYRTVKCSDCHRSPNADITLSKVITKNKGTSRAYNFVRQRARQIAKGLGWNKCCRCDYDKHIEIAHIKPISSFSKDALLSEINKPSNLLPMCPNCHWEFDNLKVVEEGFEPSIFCV